MPVIDLTHRIESGMPVFPGTPPPLIERAFTINKDGFAETRLNMLSHTGTHMDAPAHMLAKGITLDQLPADRFTGKALCIDVRKSAEITVSLLMPYEPTLSEVDFLLLVTGWDQKWGCDDYYYSYPALTEEAARWLTRFNLSGIGTDCISFDLHDSSLYPVHHILLEKGFILIENLKGTDRLAGTTFGFICTPLHYEGADGAPVRALALTNNEPFTN